MEQDVNKTRSTITRDMVAAEAGVSSATVSRVYNTPHTVSREKRTAVLQAAEALGYVPNKSASALRRNGTGVITLVEIQKESRPYYWGNIPIFNLFYGDVIKGVKSVLDQTMYHLNLETVSSLADLKRLQSQCDGMLFFDVDSDTESSAIEQLSIPYVAAHHTQSFSSLSRCSTDNHLGGRLQADELHALGVSRPLYITTFLDSVQPHADRLDGFLERWHEIGSDCTKVLVVENSEVTLETTIMQIREALLKGCDGVAAVNDVMLLRSINMLIRQKYLTHFELPAVGYDAIPFQDVIPYTFSSIDINQKSIYQRAAELLIEQLTYPSGARGGSELPSETISPTVIHGW